MIESLRNTLDKIEQELINQISLLHASLKPLEKELTDVRKAKAALTEHNAPAEEHSISTISNDTPQDPRANSAYGHYTMKMLVLKALEENFIRGATTNQMLELFTTTFGRPDIVRSSLSPQLSRLKDEKRLEKNGIVWRLIQPANPENPQDRADYDLLEKIALERITKSDNEKNEAPTEKPVGAS
jgi:hypothetical protein